MGTFFTEVQLPTKRRRLLTIEGRAVDRGAAEVMITLEGHTTHTPCVFGEPGDLDVLGAYTLLVPPSCVTSSAISSIVSGRLYSDRAERVVRPVQMTVAPASPSAAAMPRPAPRVAPATTATRPAQRIGIR
jgi:hypothetical protein